MNVKVSIIMPVYNATPYLHRAIDSIVAQTMREWELILVDDGSTDGSGNICAEYAKKDSRIKVYHKNNGGVASARQLGTDIAKGDYSIHFDADDWAEKKMLEEMVTVIEQSQADILISDFIYDEGAGKEYIEEAYNCSKNSIDVLKSILGGYNHGALWNKLIRHSLYKKYNVRYIEGVNYCEDVLILAQLMRHNIKISFSGQAHYHYCMENQASITRFYTKETYIMRQKYIKELKTILSENEYQGVVDYATLRVKLEAINKGLLEWNEINNCPDWMKTSFMAPHNGSFAKKLWMRYGFWWIVEKFRL